MFIQFSTVFHVMETQLEISSKTFWLSSLSLPLSVSCRHSAVPAGLRGDGALGFDGNFHDAVVLEEAEQTECTCRCQPTGVSSGDA